VMAARRRTQKVNDALGWLHHAPRSSEVGAARAGLFLQIHNLCIHKNRENRAIKTTYSRG